MKGVCMNKFKICFTFLMLGVALLAVTPKTFAQGMMGGFNNGASVSEATVASTAKDEADGKVVYDRLMSKQVACANLTDDEFDVLGDYFMGLRLGDTASHAYMNNMMTRMMGEQGEKQMHISLGKRLSGCDNSSPLPSNGSNFLPMMGLGGMMGRNSNYFNEGSNSMMGYGNLNNYNNMMGWGYGLFNWLPMVLFWVLLIVGAVALIRYLAGSNKTRKHDNTSFDILKERYAKGEIDKKTFEEMMKDLA